MIKILYIIPRLAKAGTELHLLNLANGLDKSKFDVTICSLFVDTNYHKFVTNYHEWCRIICLKRKNVYDLRVMWDLYKLIKKGRYDIVHTYLFGFHILAAVPAKLILAENSIKNMITVIKKRDYSDRRKVPVVVSSRRQLATWKKWHHILLTKLGNLFVDKIIANSNAVREFAIGQENLNPDKIITIYNGVDLEKFYPTDKNKELLNEFSIEEDIPVIGMIANFSENKNHKLLFSALELIKEEGVKFRCVLVGEGPLMQNAKRLTHSARLKENVIFTGSRNDIPELLSIMDIFVLTSKVEGMPNVILEAMACGKPVIATNVGGIPEIITDGEGGILVPSQNPDALAEAIINLLNDGNLREKMGQKGRKIAEEKFSLRRMITKYERSYNGLIDRF